MNIKLVATLLALPLLAACAPQVESTLYLTDVQKVLADGKALETPALLRIPQSGEDDCKKGLAALIEKVKTLAPVTGKGQCISKDGDQLAEIETSIQIVTPASTYDAANLFALVATPGTDGKTNLAFHVLKPIDDIVKALAPDDSASTDFDPTKFILHINNDGRDPAELLAGGEVFIDGKPHLSGGDPVSVPRRGEIEIRFSDVASAFAEQGNAYTFAAVTLD